MNKTRYNTELAWLNEEDAITQEMERLGYNVLSQKSGEPAGWRIEGNGTLVDEANRKLREIQQTRANRI